VWITGVLLVVGAALVVAQPVSAADWVPPSGNGLLRVGSNKCVEVIPTSGNIMYAGNRLQIRTCDGSPQQQWFFDIIAYIGCSNCAVYHIVNRYTGLCIDNMDGASNNRNPLQQWTCNGSDTMAWGINYGPPFQFFNKRSGKYMDVTDGLIVDGTRIQQYDGIDYPNNAAQNFRLN
jgi:hypothetical protein